MRKFAVSVAMVIALLGLLFSVTPPAFAGEPGKVGWKVVLSLDCSTGSVELGANDAGSSYARMPVTGPVNMDIEAGYSSRIHQGANSSFVDCLFVEPQASAPAAFQLSWVSYNWDPIWFYQPGDLWSPWQVHGQFLDNGETTRWLDFSRAGSIVLSNYAPQHYLDGKPFYQILVSTNPVPEPGSMAALFSGLVGLGGFIRRRK